MDELESSELGTIDGGLLGSALALDEVLAGLLPFFGALDHGDFLSHVQADDVVVAGIRQIWRAGLTCDFLLD